MTSAYELSRKVTQEECPWLERDYEEGEIVYAYYGCTYGCVTPSGTACSEVEGETPFLEFPTDALRPGTPSPDDVAKTDELRKSFTSFAASVDKVLDDISTKKTEADCNMYGDESSYGKK